MIKTIFGSIICPILVIVLYWAYDSFPVKVKPAMISIPLSREITWDNDKFQVDLPQTSPGHLVVLFNDTNESYVVSCQMDGISMSKILSNTYNSQHSLLTQQIRNGIKSNYSFKIEHFYLEKDNDIPLVVLGDITNFNSTPIIKYGNKPFATGYIFTQNEIIKWSIVIAGVAMALTIPLVLLWSGIRSLISSRRDQYSYLN